MTRLNFVRAVRLRSMRTVLTIQALNSFGVGVFGVVLPLMMKERNVSIVTAGFIFAALPLIMQLGRIIFATLSDFWGRKLFFVSSGLLGVASCLIFYGAHTTLEYLAGKVSEGAKDATLWAVNRAFLLEESRGQWRVLVNLRTVTYAARAVGSFSAGYLVVWFLFKGTMLLSALLGALVVLVSLTLAEPRKNQFWMRKALRFLDFRNKDRIFKIFFFLFSMMGVSYGLVGGFVITWFLSVKGFTPEVIGIIFSVQILLAGLFSHLIPRIMGARSTTLGIPACGILFLVIFLLLGFSSPVHTSILIAIFGVVEGLSAIAIERILTMISDKESYATDIGLLWTGYHVAESLSLALAGYLISVWGFVAPFSLASLTYIIFSVGAYHHLTSTRLS